MFAHIYLRPRVPIYKDPLGASVYLLPFPRSYSHVSFIVYRNSNTFRSYSLHVSQCFPACFCMLGFHFFFEYSLEVNLSSAAHLGRLRLRVHCSLLLARDEVVLQTSLYVNALHHHCQHFTVTPTSIALPSTLLSILSMLSLIPLSTPSSCDCPSWHQH